MNDETITDREIAHFLLTATKEDLRDYLMEAVLDEGERVLNTLEEVVVEVREGWNDIKAQVTVDV